MCLVSIVPLGGPPRCKSRESDEFRTGEQPEHVHRPLLAVRQVRDLHEDLALVKLVITAGDRRNLLAEVTRVIGDLGVNIHSGEFGTDHQVARATMIVEVHNLNDLQRILKAVQKIPGIERIDRYQVG